METFIKTVVLDHEVEARLMDSILTERSIPHVMTSYHDSAYDGLYQMMKGWGHVEAPADYAGEIKEILREIKREAQRDENGPSQQTS